VIFFSEEFVARSSLGDLMDIEELTATIVLVSPKLLTGIRWRFMTVSFRTGSRSLSFADCLISKPSVGPG